MNVSELRKILLDLPGDMIIVLSSDIEGNGYSPLAAHDVCSYIEESTWSGYLDENDEEGVPALVLWPTN